MQLHYSYTTVTVQLQYSYSTVTVQLHYSYTTVTVQLQYSYSTVTAIAIAVLLNNNTQYTWVKTRQRYSTVQLHYSFSTVTNSTQYEKLCHLTTTIFTPQQLLPIPQWIFCIIAGIYWRLSRFCSIMCHGPWATQLLTSMLDPLHLQGSAQCVGVGGSGMPDPPHFEASPSPIAPPSVLLWSARVWHARPSWAVVCANVHHTCILYNVAI